MTDTPQTEHPEIVDRLQTARKKLREQISRVVIGQERVIDLLLVKQGLGTQYNRNDVAILIQNFGIVTAASPAASQSQVPEPGTLLLAVIGLVCDAGRRGRRRSLAN